MDDDPKRVELAPMVSWLSDRIREYLDPLSVKRCVPTLRNRASVRI